MEPQLRAACSWSKMIASEADRRSKPLGKLTRPPLL
jgi:hypothetical protein